MLSKEVGSILRYAMSAHRPYLVWGPYSFSKTVWFFTVSVYFNTVGLPIELILQQRKTILNIKKTVSIEDFTQDFDNTYNR